MRIACLFDGSVSRPTACGYIRLLLPLTAERDHHQFNIDFLSLDDIQQRRYDIVITQRAAFRNKRGLDRLLEIQKLGTKIVYDLDDDLVAIDDDHPEFEAYTHLSPAILEAMTEADDVWFSTAALAQRYGERAKRHTVFRNHLDGRLWRPAEPDRRPEGSPFSVLFMGSGTHQADVRELLGPALAKIHEKFRGRFKFFSIGVNKAAFGKVPVTQIDVPGNVAGSYPAFVNWLQRLPRFSLGVAPLLPTLINKSKSHIKWLEYAAMGLPTIASSVGEYAESIGRTGPGILAAGWQDFYAALAKQADDFTSYQSLSLEVARFAKAHVELAAAETGRLNRINLLAAGAIPN